MTAPPPWLRAVLEGTVRYAQDFELPGMLHGRILRSPDPHARVLRVDTSAVPDDVVVLTPDDVLQLGRYGCQNADQTVLAVERAAFAGAAVAAVAAASEEEAESALALIEVDYEELPAALDLEEALDGAVRVHERHQISDNAAADVGSRPQGGPNGRRSGREHR